LVLGILLLLGVGYLLHAAADDIVERTPPGAWMAQVNARARAMSGRKRPTRGTAEYPEGAERWGG
jgi:hypothetical protein